MGKMEQMDIFSLFDFNEEKASEIVVKKEVLSTSSIEIASEEALDGPFPKDSQVFYNSGYTQFDYKPVTYLKPYNEDGTLSSIRMDGEVAVVLTTQLSKEQNDFPF